MEELKDCSENNQNTNRLFFSHEHNNKTGNMCEQSASLEHSTSWTTLGGVGVGVERQSEKPATVHNWVTAAVMHVSHLNNTNNNNVQHCDNMSGNAGFDYNNEQHESRPNVMSGCSNWTKNPFVQNPWNYDRYDASSLTTATPTTTTACDTENKADNMEMQTNGEPALVATTRVLSKLAALVIHDAPVSPTSNTITGACCLDYNDSDFEYEEENIGSLGATAMNLTLKRDTSEETGAGAGCAGAHSNRTSINNSTDNLSYSSDNLYANDLMLREENADIEPEEISLNSDDCIYAYRGDGIEFELELDDVLNRRVIGGSGALNDAVHNSTGVDDETEFLEMDFDPDPLSEAEYSTVVADMAANTFLLQRHSCHLSGRHSASNSPLHTRQHFSSPTEDIPTLNEALQNQSILSKNFACINLHLDQINETLCVDESTRNLAQSLPNTLHEHCASKEIPLNNTNSVEEVHVNSKITGAKPKRSSTLTTKHISHKSRASRSAMGAVYVGSSSFDERSLSCNEFRSSGLDAVAQQSMDCLVGTPLVGVAEYNSDEACLDCLEREFLANTIGKVLEPNKECNKCRKRSSSSSITLYETAEKLAQRCRSSGSSTSFFYEHATLDSCLFDTSNEFLCETTKLPTPLYNADEKCAKRQTFDNELLDQRENETDIGEKLLKNLHMTERKTVTVPILNLSEEILTQALNKLNLNYNQELLNKYFARYYNNNNNTQKENFKNLKHFLLHEAKRQGNYVKLKCVIEAATRLQVTVQFEHTHTQRGMDEQISVKVCDILYQWSRHKDLTMLLHLGKRFAEANVVGKITNIIRQTEQQCTMRRPLPEYITIPQYYPTGELILTKTF